MTCWRRPPSTDCCTTANTLIRGELPAQAEEEGRTARTTSAGERISRKTQKGQKEEMKRRGGTPTRCTPTGAPTLAALATTNRR
jgi:hypothetical protein